MESGGYVGFANLPNQVSKLVNIGGKLVKKCETGAAPFITPPLPLNWFFLYLLLLLYFLTLVIYVVHWCVFARCIVRASRKVSSLRWWWWEKAAWARVRWSTRCSSPTSIPTEAILVQLRGRSRRWSLKVRPLWVIGFLGTVLIDFFFSSLCPFTASTVEIEERGVKLRLTVVDTPGKQQCGGGGWES